MQRKRSQPARYIGRQNRRNARSIHRRLGKLVKRWLFQNQVVIDGIISVVAMKIIIIVRKITMDASYDVAIRIQLRRIEDEIQKKIIVFKRQKCSHRRWI